MFNFDDVGKQIKTIAKICAIIIFAGGVLAGFGILIGGCAAGDGVGPFLLAFLVAAIVIGLSYLTARLSVIMMYGFGELIDQTTQLNRKIGWQPSQPSPQPAPPVQNAGFNAPPRQYIQNDGMVPAWKRVEMEKEKNNQF